VPSMPLVRLRWVRDAAAPAVDFGDVLIVRGLLQPVIGPQAPPESASYWQRHGVAATVRALPRGIQLAPSTGWSLGRLAARARRAAAGSFQHMLGERRGAVLTGVVLGSVTAIPEDLSEDFRVTGTVHVLACSGANVGLVAGLVSLPAALCGLRRRPRAMVVLLAVVAYTVIAGSKPSVVRAAIMAAAVLAPDLLDREPDDATSMSLAASAICGWDPGNLWDPGFQLSFAIVTYLMISRSFLAGISQRVQARLAGMGLQTGLLPAALCGAISVVLATFVAHAAAAPLVAYHFNQVCLVGLLANLIVVPLSGIALMVGLPVAALSPAAPEASALAGAWLLSPVVCAMEGSVRWFAGLPWASANVVAPPLTAVIVAYVVLAFLLLRGTRWVSGGAS